MFVLTETSAHAATVPCPRGDGRGARRAHRARPRRHTRPRPEGGQRTATSDAGWWRPSAGALRRGRADRRDCVLARYPTERRVADHRGRLEPDGERWTSHYRGLNGPLRTAIRIGVTARHGRQRVTIDAPPVTAYRRKGDPGVSDWASSAIRPRVLRSGPGSGPAVSRSGRPLEVDGTFVPRRARPPPDHG